MGLNGKDREMKKNILIIACFLLITANAYADATNNGRSPRDWDSAATASKLLQPGDNDFTDNTSIFANSVNTGNNATGNAGYQGLMAVGPDGIARTYYLWVDGSANNGVGILRMASLPAISAAQFTSFPYGDWRSSTGFVAGGKVSGQ